jgi:hypothetical protein
MWKKIFLEMVRFLHQLGSTTRRTIREARFRGTTFAATALASASGAAEFENAT